MSTNDAVFTDRAATAATPAGNAVSFETIAEAIRMMKPSALPEHALADVITMIEYMQGELTARHEAQVRHAAHLAEQFADLEGREAALAIRQRAVAVMEKAKAAPRGVFAVLSRARG